MKLTYTFLIYFILLIFNSRVSEDKKIDSNASLGEAYCYENYNPNGTSQSGFYWCEPVPQGQCIWIENGEPIGELGAATCFHQY